MTEKLVVKVKGSLQKNCDYSDIDPVRWEGGRPVFLNTPE